MHPRRSRSQRISASHFILHLTYSLWATLFRHLYLKFKTMDCSSPSTMNDLNVAPSPTPITSKRISSRSVTGLFPAKLYGMLAECTDSTSGLSEVVSWQPHGRAFMVHDRDRFMSEVVPRFFNVTKLRSFQRQLNLWGFHR